MGAISYDNTTGIFTYTPPVISGGSGITAYANTTDLPTSGVTTGAMAYVSGNNKLYLWNGTAWFNIAIVNQAPTAITGNQATYVLATDGTPTVVTLVSTDPEGLPLTWSSSTSGDTQVGTVTNSDNVFTITPSTNEANIGTLSVTFSVTDGNNTETSVSSFILEFLSPYWNETVLSIGTSSTNGLANSTFIDRSTNAHTVTPGGAPVQTAFHPYLENWSVEFSKDSVTIPTSAEFNIGNGDFTFETWINTTGGGTIFDFGANTNVTFNGWRLAFQSIGYLILTINQQSNSDSGQYTLTGSTVINNGKWNHIRITRTGTTFRIFVNGVLDVLGTSSVTGYQANSDFIIGGNLSSNALNSSFTGYLSSFRLIKGTSLNTTNDSFNVPTENLTNVSGTSLLLFNSNRFIDLSLTGHSLTSIGAKVSAFSPFGQESEYAVGENKGSAYFSGTGDNLLETSQSGQFAPTGDFTIGLWFYPNSALTINQNIVGNLTADLATDWLIQMVSGAFRVYTNGVTVRITSSTAIIPFQWNYISVTRSSNVISAHINNTLIGTYSQSGTFGTASKKIQISNAANETNGFVSDLILIDGSSDTSLPTAPVGNTNASLYLPFDNAGIFDKTGNNTLTPVGNASTSTTQTKYADTAMYFDGSGDYVKINTDDTLSTDFTIEMWVNYTTSGSAAPNERIFTSTNSGNTVDNLQFIKGNIADGSGIGIYSNVFLFDDFSNPQNDGLWHHLCVTRSGNIMRFFIDGVQPLPSITNSQSYTVQNSLVGTRDEGVNTSNFNGYIENLQILKGVAKYTANFTPPNRTQGRTYQAES